MYKLDKKSQLHATEHTASTGQYVAPTISSTTNKTFDHEDMKNKKSGTPPLNKPKEDKKKTIGSASSSKNSTESMASPTKGKRFGFKHLPY